MSTLWGRIAAGRAFLFKLRGGGSRGQHGRQIAGVCIGLSQAYGWDVALVRIFTALGLFFSGGVVGVAYVACWIGIPEEPYPMP